MTKNQTSIECIFCTNILSENTKPEHVLLNALGGRFTVKDVICSDCNQHFGNGPDKDLAESVAFIRNICDLRSGSGSLPPQIKRMKTDGQTMDLLPGMSPRIRADKPMNVTSTEQGTEIEIVAHSEEEAKALVHAAAKKIVKEQNIANPEGIKRIEQDIWKEKKSTFKPAPTIETRLALGGGQSLQAMAKACLVLWANSVGNVEVKSSKYDRVRSFIKTVCDHEAQKILISIDTRPLPIVPDAFGEHPNLIWAGSDENGRVYGYFRLYGAIGWRFLLCDAHAPALHSTCLISNPFDLKTWKILKRDEQPISFNWVDVNAAPDWTAAKARISLLVAYASGLSQSNWSEELVMNAAKRAGLVDGESPTEEQKKIMLNYMAQAMTASILRTEVSDD